VNNNNKKRGSSLKFRGYNPLEIVDWKRNFREHEGGMTGIEIILQVS